MSNTTELFSLACDGNYVTYMESNAEGATSYSHITSVDECASLCDNMLACVAFDWDYNDPPYQGSHCWVHTNPNIAMKSQPFVNHHVKQPGCAIGKTYLKQQTSYTFTSHSNRLYYFSVIC